MPFLRRRGVASSETDMRRRTLLSETSHLKDLPTMESSASLDRSSNTRVIPSSSLRPPKTPDAPAAISHLTASPGRASVDAAGSQTTTPSPPPLVSRQQQDDARKRRRFSTLRFRNASDSQLSTRARQQALAAEEIPPMPKPPEIVKTSPTVEFAKPTSPKRKSSRLTLGAYSRSVTDINADSQKRFKKDSRKSLIDFTTQHVPRLSAEDAMPRAAATSRDGPPSLGTPPRKSSEPAGRSRLSQSSMSSLGDSQSSPIASAQNSKESHGFFRLRRRKSKHAEPLFNLAHLPQRGKAPTHVAESRTSTASLAVPSTISENPDQSHKNSNDRSEATPDTSLDYSTVINLPTTGMSPAIVLTDRTAQSPATAIFRPTSVSSAQSSPTRLHLSTRERSSTVSSHRDSVDDRLSPSAGGRPSISSGRKSFGDMLGLSRFRQSPNPMSAGSNASTKANSLQLPRTSVSLPERLDEDTPAKYLVKVEAVMSRSVIASTLCQHADPFYLAVLRSYMRRFLFFDDPMDMALRKLLMEAELPKETQQIDRCIQAFSHRYHECNPGIYLSADQAYFIAFSLLILHTDAFNKNNKNKMQKADYLKNVSGDGVYEDVLDCFYDNITYTPFIHVEEELDVNGERTPSSKSKKRSVFTNGSPEAVVKASKEPLDPYMLILEKKLDVLRPNLGSVMELDDHYNYLGTASSLNLSDLQKTFFKTGVLQIISPRSRPDAFMTAKTAHNPAAAHPGIVDIRITKVGLLWRKDAKKRKARSPWQEWGAILTGAQLYFFRNVQWVKSLMSQLENHLKQGNDGIPCIFKPPLEQFKPDALMSTDGAVAVVDSTYKKHKHAFVYVRSGGMDEVLLANDEDEMNDWLAKLNYAAAFRTSGVRMRGVVGSNYDGQRTRGLRRLDSSDKLQSIQTPTGEVTIARGHIDQTMANDILTSRRTAMNEKVIEANQKLSAAEKQLDSQLRNARHLQILAPIQEKTRDQVLLAAGRVAAQMKWTRTEIWRLKCHRDILQLDLEEESKLAKFAPSPPSPPITTITPAAAAAATATTTTPTSTFTSTTPPSPPPPPPVLPTLYNIQSKKIMAAPGPDKPRPPPIDTATSSCVTSGAASSPFVSVISPFTGAAIVAAGLDSPLSQRLSDQEDDNQTSFAASTGESSGNELFQTPPTSAVPFDAL